MKEFLKSKLGKQILRFTILGFGAFFIDYGIYKILSGCFGVEYLVANLIGFVVSVIINYIVSIHWVFEVKKKQTKTEFIIFVILSAIGLGINEAIMYLGHGLLGFNDTFIKCGATGVVMVYNFITRKMFLEKKDRR